MWYHLSAGSKAAFRGNLMTIFLLMSAVRVPSYVAGGLVTAPRLWSTLAVAPAVLVGAWLGHRVHVRIGEELFRRLVVADYPFQKDRIFAYLNLSDDELLIYDKLYALL